jgi:hypothetical protein
MCFELVNSMQIMPLVDLAEFVFSATYCAAAWVFQDTWIAHLLIIMPAISLSAILKLITVVPLLANRPHTQ